MAYARRVTLSLESSGGRSTVSSQRLLAVCAFALALAPIASSEPRGVQPRSSRMDYFVTSFTRSFAFAATMVPSGDVVRLFGAEAAKRYVVVEMGFFSKDGGTYQLRHSDFSLKVQPTGAMVHAASPTEVEQIAGPNAERQILPEGAARRTGGYLFFPAHLASSDGCEVEYTGLESWLSMPVRYWR